MGLIPDHNSVKKGCIWILFLLMVSGSGFSKAQSPIPDQSVIIRSVNLSGNAKTRDYLIYRELLFNQGDTVSLTGFGMQVYQSRLNLLNTSLFNFVTIDTVFTLATGQIAKVDISISLLERWYIWPVPIIKITDRNFNTWWQTRDFTRINYGLDIKWHNFTGRMDELDAILQFGKNRQFGVSYLNPYIDRRKHFGMGFEAGYKKNRETGYITQNDKLEFAFIPEGLSTEKYFALKTTYRNSIFTTHALVAGLKTLTFSDSLLSLNPDYSYPGLSDPTFLYLYYKLKLDHRNIKYYPIKGWYVDLELNKQGLGFGFEKPVDVFWLKSTTRLYSKLSERWFTGVSVTGKISSGAWQPYFLIRGLGYDNDYVRGYEYQVIDGKHFMLVHSTVKFALVPEQSRNIGLIPTPKFGLIHYALYLTAFADGGYVWQPQWLGLSSNKLPQTMLAGAGVGLDFVTYYDKVIRIEYSINKSGKSGIFIHFIAGI
jgi:outer membrane protein assembly factor BamA